MGEIRLRLWRAYGNTVEIQHTRDLSADDSEQARIAAAVHAYVTALAAPPPKHEGEEG